LPLPRNRAVEPTFDAWTTPIALGDTADPNAPVGPRIVLLNDCRDQVNFGANVLMEGLTEIVARVAPTATLVPIPSYWLVEKSAFDGFVSGTRLHQPQAVFPSVADEFETVAERWRDGHGGPHAGEFLRRFEGADLVILNGEGSLYRTNQSAIREVFLAWYCKTQLGIPTVFANGMVHLTGVMPVLPAMVRRTFAVLDAVAVREPRSLRNLHEYAPDVHARVFPDSAFVVTPDQAQSTPAVDAIRRRIGDDAYFCFDPGAMPMDHRPSRRSGLYELISRLKTVVPQAVLVNSAPADAYIEQIAEETGSVYVDTLTDFREYMALVADAQFVASGRYHNPILAAIMGCPSITFSSTNHKVHGACETLEDVGGSPYDGTDLRTHLDAIEAHARRFVDQRADFAARLDTLCTRLRTEAYALGPFALAPLRTAPDAHDAQTVGR
jgi:polysaccharide pyruvyl transferase WcaK-like protein